MKILISDEEVMKRIIGHPTIYYTSDYEKLYNGSLIKFYYDYFDKSKFIYGQINYDIISKDYYINFNKFKKYNNLQNYDNIYLSKIDPNISDGKIIIKLDIHKSSNLNEFPEIYYIFEEQIRYYKQCQLCLHNIDKFNKLITKMYRCGHIDFLKDEIEDDKFIINDPELTIDVTFTLTGKEITTFNFININKICEEVENVLLHKEISTNKSISGYIDFAESSEIRVFFEYKPKPEHKLIIRLSKREYNCTNNYQVTV